MSLPNKTNRQIVNKQTWMLPSEALNRSFNRQADENLARAALIQQETTRRLGFHIGNIGLLIAQHATSELTDLLPVCPVPNTAEWLQGIINLRGNLIPVFDLNLLLRIESDNPLKRKQMLLILGQGEAAGAVLIDDLPIHLTLAENDKLQNLPPLPPAIKPYATIAYELNGEVWFNFDHEGFFQSLATKVAT